MDFKTGSAIALLFAVALFAFSTQNHITEQKEDLDQLLDEELFIDQLADLNKPKIEVKPDVVPDHEDKKEVTPDPLPIPEFKQYEPRRRFLFRRGVSHELSCGNLGCNIRHASQSAYSWDY